MPERPTLLTLAALNSDNFGLGVIEESIQSAPEFNVAHAVVMKGTSYKTTVRIGLPSVGFRSANEGITASASRFDARLVECFIFDSRIECDKAIADAYIHGPEMYKATESVGVMTSGLRAIGNQFYYGPRGSGLNAEKGFPGLVDLYDPANMEVDAQGENDTTSVWLVRFGEQDAHFVLGNNGPRIPGVDGWRVETLRDANGKAFDGYVSSVCMWVGLAVHRVNAVARIKNIGGAEGTTLTFDHIHRALETFPAGMPPTHIFMNKRSQRQLREDQKTDLNRTPATPTNVDNVPIVPTDSIMNTEDTLPAA